MDVQTALAAFFTPEPVFMDEGGLAAGGPGFALFGTGHLLMLALCCLLIAVLVVRFMRLPEGVAWGSPRRRFLVSCACVPVALLASRDIALVACGLFIPVFWPLHICNFCEYLAVAFALSASERVGDVFYPWACVGGTGALLFPSWTYCPLASYASIGGFIEHALLVTMVICMVCGREYRPSYRRLWLPFVVAVAAGAFFLAFNPVFGTNFFFVTKPLPNTPFEWAAAVVGDPGYLLPYAALALGAWALFVKAGRALYDAAGAKTERTRAA